MNTATTHPADAYDGAARYAVQMLFSKFRWLGTAVLECTLGTMFLVAPGLTLQTLESEHTASMEVMFRLYGALLIHRGLVQQIFYRARDVAQFRKLLWASLPFSIGSTVVLSAAVVNGLMAPLVGWIVVATFVIEVIDNGSILALTRPRRGAKRPVGRERRLETGALH